jgi:hypothetical protein
MSDFYFGSLTKDSRFLALVLVFGNNFPHKFQENCSDLLIKFAGRIGSKLNPETLSSPEYEKIVNEAKRELLGHDGAGNERVDRRTQVNIGLWGKIIYTSNTCW